jgi:hypothetical protein
MDQKNSKARIEITAAEVAVAKELAKRFDELQEKWAIPGSEDAFREDLTELMTWLSGAVQKLYC